MQKDLLKRLKAVSHILRHEGVQSNSPDYPGLDSLATALEDTFIYHQDKEIRLYSVLCCMEVFAIVSLWKEIVNI